MNNSTMSASTASPARLPKHTCPACGMAAPAVLAVLPSGRKVVVEACAICGHQQVMPVGPEQARLLTDKPQELGENRQNAVGRK